MEETKWFTEEELHDECWKDSTNWIKAGSGSLGKVYVEVLQCRDLPNVDTGPGNKTDAFVSIVYGDCQVQTEVINGKPIQIDRGYFFMFQLMPMFLFIFCQTRFTGSDVDAMDEGKPLKSIEC